MERNNKTLLIAVLVMLLALVALNFNNISGKATERGNVVVRVSPTTIQSIPSSVNLYIDTGNVRVDTTANLYRDDGSRVGITGKVCKGSTCEGVMNAQFYLDSSVTPGRYFIRLRQTGTGNYGHDSNRFIVQ